MELPFHLKTIEPLKGALDIIRYLGKTDEQTVHADAICDDLDLSDRSFSKAIRRLVTKGYVIMDGDMEYRLTEQGHDAVDELNEYDAATGGVAGGEAEQEMAAEEHIIARRMVLALPGQVAAGQTNPVLLGVHDAAAGAEMDGTAEMVARISVINGDPEQPEDLIFSLDNSHMQQSLEITPHNFTEIRIRVEVFQLGDNPGEIHKSGGMFIDVPVTQNSAAPLTAYGTDIEITM